MANRYFLIEVPGGIANAYMKCKIIDRVHLLRFSAFECAKYQVGWNEANYPIGCEDYLTEGEFRKLKRHHPNSVDSPFPHMLGFTNFYNPAHPAHLVRGRVPLQLHRLSPSERRECFTSYRACDKPVVHVWCQMGALIDCLSAHLVVVHPLLCPVPGATTLPLSLLIILSQPPPTLAPLLLVLFLLLVFVVADLAIMSGNVMT